MNSAQKECVERIQEARRALYIAAEKSDNTSLVEELLAHRRLLMILEEKALKLHEVEFS